MKGGSGEREALMSHREVQELSTLEVKGEVVGGLSLPGEERVPTSEVWCGSGLVFSLQGLPPGCVYWLFGRSEGPEPKPQHTRQGWKALSSISRDCIPSVLLPGAPPGLLNHMISTVSSPQKGGELLGRV
jgi:hypothetical protein